MIIIDTAHHITFSSFSEIPVLACVGKCKKIFWKDDIQKETEKCPQCDCEITDAVQDVHFNILSKADRNLKLSDFKQHVPLTHTDKQQLKSYFSIDAIIQHMSIVKSEFEQFAVSEWIPHGLNTEKSIKYK
tara:strand:- start:3649 stop:4041 length:393 start_codon:yes stop_codon:yes gene_type:complete